MRACFFYGRKPGTIVLGWDEEGNEITVSFIEDIRNLEDYLLLTRATRWRRWKAKWLGLKMSLGKFRPVNATGYFEYFLFLHKRCNYFVVSRPYGFDERLECLECLNNESVTTTPYKPGYYSGDGD